MGQNAPNLRERPEERRNPQRVSISPASRLA
ncbi:hypothetical protein MSS2_00270 [Mycobacterium marinum]|nr:hypothetical protein MSS2_00270 [Mycobacterium marinum]